MKIVICNAYVGNSFLGLKFNLFTRLRYYGIKFLYEKLVHGPIIILMDILQP